ncbi:hypothetical protein [Stenotrophomonas sp. HMSC10F06]|uniref:hypothetical protein n=1 Tax=Stenotrophomonas sp. HMSC10F06 TaxID=1581081 RepID=UPI001585FF8D|nr:hypothetical protein [Stenotrophomonas sp. HMSC10F06]
MIRIEVSTLERAEAAGTADIKKAPASTARDAASEEWLGTTLSHLFVFTAGFVNSWFPAAAVNTPCCICAKTRCGVHDERWVAVSKPFSKT